MKLNFLKKINTKVFIICTIVALLVIGGGTVWALTASNSRSTEISEQEAKAAAFAHAGISEAEVLSLRVSKGTEDGSPVYEIDFKTADKSYDYDVARISGEILQSSYDANGQETTGGLLQPDSSTDISDNVDSAIDPGMSTTDTPTPNDTENTTNDTNAPSQPQSNNTASAITQEKAKEIALQDAGIAETDTQFLWVKEDYDDGRLVYDVEFYANGTEYDYEIEKSTGQIISSDFDIEHYSPNNGNNGGNGTIISVDKARNIVLAKVPGATANDVYIHLDHDDGRQIYEGEIYYNRTEYEFEMDASTGNIIEWSAEHWD